MKVDLNHAFSLLRQLHHVGTFTAQVLPLDHAEMIALVLQIRKIQCQQLVQVNMNKTIGVALIVLWPHSSGRRDVSLVRHIVVEHSHEQILLFSGCTLEPDDSGSIGAIRCGVNRQPGNQQADYQQKQGQPDAEGSCFHKRIRPFEFFSI